MMMLSLEPRLDPLSWCTPKGLDPVHSTLSLLPLDQKPVPNLGYYLFLIVDDNVLNLRIFNRVLKKLFPKARIDTVQDSTLVLSLQLDTYHVIFLDIEMPEVTGVDIARSVRGNNKLDQTGLIAVTTRHMSSDVQLYNLCGFDYTIPKPVYQHWTILEHIENVLDKRCHQILQR